MQISEGFLSTHWCSWARRQWLEERCTETDRTRPCQRDADHIKKSFAKLCQQTSTLSTCIYTCRQTTRLQIQRKREKERRGAQRGSFVYMCGRLSRISLASFVPSFLPSFLFFYPWHSYLFAVYLSPSCSRYWFNSSFFRSKGRRTALDSTTAFLSILRSAWD